MYEVTLVKEEQSMQDLLSYESNDNFTQKIAFMDIPKFFQPNQILRYVLHTKHYFLFTDVKPL